MALNTASAPRSASRPTSCTRADPSGSRGSPRKYVVLGDGSVRPERHANVDLACRTYQRSWHLRLRCRWHPARHVKTAHQADPGTGLAFSTAAARCEVALSLRGQMIAFEHLYDTDEGTVRAQLCRSGGGLWEMLWPVALLALTLVIGRFWGGLRLRFHHRLVAPVHECRPIGLRSGGPTQPVGRKLLGSHP